MLYRQMPRNIQLNWIKRVYSAKQKQQFGDTVQDCKNGRGSQFIKFDLVTGGPQEIKIAVREEF